MSKKPSKPWEKKAEDLVVAVAPITGTFASAMSLEVAKKVGSVIGFDTQSKIMQLMGDYDEQGVCFLPKLKEHGKQFVPDKKFSFTSDLERLARADILLSGFPIAGIQKEISNGVHLCLEEILGSLSEDAIILNLAKGINGTQVPFEMITSMNLFRGKHYATLAGPNFAYGMGEDPTAVTIASQKSEVSKTLERIFSTDSLYVVPVAYRKAPKFIEQMSALKNVYAITCGIARGMGFRENTHVVVVMRAIREIKKIMRILGGKKVIVEGSEGVDGPAGIGDIILTCSSESSRNFSYGKRIGEQIVKQLEKSESGLSYEKTEELLQGQTVEGYKTLKSVYEELLADVENLPEIAPFLDLTYRTIFQGASPMEYKRIFFNS